MEGNPFFILFLYRVKVFVSLHNAYRKECNESPCALALLFLPAPLWENIIAHINTGEWGRKLFKHEIAQLCAAEHFPNSSEQLSCPIWKLRGSQVTEALFAIKVQQPFPCVKGGDISKQCCWASGKA